MYINLCGNRLIQLEKSLNILHLSKQYIKLNGITSSIEIIINNDSSNLHYVASDYIQDVFLECDKKKYLDTLFETSVQSLPYNIIKLINICRQLNINIVHCHHRYYDLLANVVKKFIDIKVITTVQSKVKDKKYFSYKSEKLIVVGESIKNHLKQYFCINENRIIVINNFISPRLISIDRNINEIKKELHIENFHHVIGFVGRFDIYEKGIDVLVNALKIIFKKDKNIVSIFIGDGLDKEYLLKEKEEIGEQIKIIDSKNNVYNYLQVFDILVLPSNIDPFPFVMLEAAYLKIPFVGSRVDGISEFVNNEEDGLLFNPGNQIELADKINDLLRNKSKRDSFAENAFNKLIKNYTIDQKIKDYQDVYIALANEKYSK